VRMILTRPDSVSKRGKELVPSPVCVAAAQLGLSDTVHTANGFYLRDDQGAALRSAQGERIIDEALIALIRQAEPDFIVVAAYGAILPAAVLALPKRACINVHASLLPRWRGAAPIQRAILAGDEEIGVSIMRVEEGLDTGPYCATAAMPIGEKNASELTAQLAQRGAELLIEALSAIADNSASWIQQDETEATYAGRIAKHELTLNPADPVLLNLRRVRASTPQAPAHCIVAGRSVTVLAARFPEQNPAQTPNQDQDQALSQASTLKSSATRDHHPHVEGRQSKRLLFACSDGDLEITELKPDGKRAMSAQAFLAGL